MEELKEIIIARIKELVNKDNVDVKLIKDLIDIYDKIATRSIQSVASNSYITEDKCNYCMNKNWSKNN